jgi:hypothetical protein
MLMLSNGQVSMLTRPSIKTVATSNCVCPLGNRAYGPREGFMMKGNLVRSTESVRKTRGSDVQSNVSKLTRSGRFVIDTLLQNRATRQ